MLGAWTERVRQSYRNEPKQFWLRCLYFAALIYIIVWWRAVWTPDVLFVMFLFLFALYGKGRQFLVSFGPFALLLLTYDGFRGLAPFLNSHVHYYEMINFDKWVGGGTLPTARLQSWLYHGSLHWYDYFVYFLYMCHFLTPWIVAILIWRFRPQHYNRYIVAFLLLSYAGFVTYVLFPAAPPWMASEKGFIPPIHKLSTDIWWAMGVHNASEVYAKFSPNLVAAVPSLHAAYPTLITLFIARAFGWRWAAAISWYPLAIWVGIVYMGEHYVFDAVVGVAYAVLTYAITNLIFARYGARARAMRERLRNRYHGAVVSASSRSTKS